MDAESDFDDGTDRCNLEDLDFGSRSTGHLGVGEPRSDQRNQQAETEMREQRSRDSNRRSRADIDIDQQDFTRCTRETDALRTQRAELHAGAHRGPDSRDRMQLGAERRAAPTAQSGSARR